MEITYQVGGQTLSATDVILWLASLPTDQIGVYQDLMTALANGKKLYGDYADKIKKSELELERLRSDLYLTFGSKDDTNPLLVKQNRITNEAINSMVIAQPEYINLENSILEMKSDRAKVWNYVETVDGCLKFVLAYMGSPKDYNLNEISGQDTMNDLSQRAAMMFGGKDE